MVFYEAPHRLRETLDALTAAFGPARRIALCRELTKLHEEILRMTLSEAAAHYAQTEPRGEYVLVVEGAQEAQEAKLSLDEALALVRQQIADGKSKKDAVKTVSALTGFPKNALYDAALKE